MKTLLLTLIAPVFLCAQNLDVRNPLRIQFAPFFHGVASGDPLHDRVIIWTRVTPDELNENTIVGTWRMATDANMTNIVASGDFSTDQTMDYTVKIDVTNLMPSTCYYYNFEVCSNYSEVGKTRTADYGFNTNARFVTVSCSNYQHGYFNVYGAIAQRDDINAVIHLGDYIYEYGVGVYSANMPDRAHIPTFETITLEDYRLRYAHYRLDKDLQAMHKSHPFICVWDDHESANDAWIGGAQNHQPATEGSWAVRKNNAIQAYFEWMPIRETSFENSIFRTIPYGDLLNLYMLDTRLEGRMAQVHASSVQLNNPERTILGQTQKTWIKDQLSNSTAKWNIIGQQVMMAPLRNAFGLPLFTDLWDGYPVERNELLNYIVDSMIHNVVVLTGDFHTSWANDLPLSNYNPFTRENSAGVEFVTTSVSSPSIPIQMTPIQIAQINPHIRWFNLEKRGFMLLDVTPERVQAEWYFNDDVYTQNEEVSFANAFFVNNQERFLRQATEISQATLSPCETAPTSYLESNDVFGFTLFGAYPNPFSDYTLLHLGSSHHQNISLGLYDVQGKLVIPQFDLDLEPGNTFFKMYGDKLPTGQFLLQISDGSQSKSHWLLKE